MDFDPAAMTEVGFRRDGAQEWDAEEFLAGHVLVREEEVMAAASHPVQEAAERAMLSDLGDKVTAIVDGLGPGQLASVESKMGVDYPRTRYHRPTTGDREFTYTLDKPLRMGVWEPK